MQKITQWRRVWRWWSVRLSALATMVWAYLLASPDLLWTVLNSLPPDLRDVVPPIAPVAVFFVVTIARNLQQGRDDGK
ncbi:DUF7940 domain-containing protein [Sphingobium yanoikuyae]|uniref:DUF7940 domain-containing protein n=1 Tax=Sphingobium yanoikuyae TaxID=13690 RepID=UPI0028AEDE6D|nr:hypothetical protein [Sphingobium yanoikuyae]